MKSVRMDTNQKSIAELIKAARAELSDGSTEGYLAFWRNEHGDRDERLAKSDKLLAEAESLFSPEDLEAAVDLWSAFKSGLGCRNVIDANKKAFHYMSLVAEAGNISAQEMLMVDYLHGLNGLPVDKERFLYWCNRAILGGSNLASKELKKYKKNNLSKGG